MQNTDNEGGKLRKFSIAMERFWLILTVISAIVVIYIFVVDGVNRMTLQYLLFPALAGAMYAFRTTFRRRFENRPPSE